MFSGEGKLKGHGKAFQNIITMFYSLEVWGECNKDGDRVWLGSWRNRHGNTELQLIFLGGWGGSFFFNQALWNIFGFENQEKLQQFNNQWVETFLHRKMCSVASCGGLVITAVPPVFHSLLRLLMQSRAVLVLRIYVIQEAMLCPVCFWFQLKW